MMRAHLRNGLLATPKAVLCRDEGCFVPRCAAIKKRTAAQESSVDTESECICAAVCRDLPQSRGRAGARVRARTRKIFERNGEYRGTSRYTQHKKRARNRRHHFAHVAYLAPSSTSTSPRGSTRHGASGAISISDRTENSARRIGTSKSILSGNGRGNDRNGPEFFFREKKTNQHAKQQGNIEMDSLNQPVDYALGSGCSQSPHLSRSVEAQGAEHGQELDDAIQEHQPAKATEGSGQTAGLVCSIGGDDVLAQPSGSAPTGTNGLGALGGATRDARSNLSGTLPTPLKRRRRKSEPLSVTPDAVLRLLDRQRFRCALTGRAVTPDTASLDHIIPVCRGGEHRIDNTQILERSVNRAKGTLTNDEFIALCADVAWHVSSKSRRQTKSKE